MKVDLYALLHRNVKRQDFVLNKKEVHINFTGKLTEVTSPKNGDIYFGTYCIKNANNIQWVYNLRLAKDEHGGALFEGCTSMFGCCTVPTVVRYRIKGGVLSVWYKMRG